MRGKAQEGGRVMIPSFTLVPAHGHDFKTARDAKTAFHANMEFLVADPLSAYDGRAITRAEIAMRLPDSTHAKLRYAKLCKSTIVKIAAEQ